MQAEYAGTALTGPAESQHATRIDVPWEVLADIAPLLGAAAPWIEARGNEHSRVSVACRREYATLLEALDARAAFVRGLAETGALTLSFGALTLAGEAWRLPCPAPVLRGCAVEFVFNFVVKDFV